MLKLKSRGNKDYRILLKYNASNVYHKLPIIILITLIGNFCYYGYKDFNKLKFHITITDDLVTTKQVLPLIVQDNLAQTVDNITLLPWVNNVKFVRKWNNIYLKLITNTIVYNYAHNDTKGFINQHGQLFIPNKMTTNNKATINCPIQDITLSTKKLQKYEDILKPLVIKEFVNGVIEYLILANGTKIILGTKNQQQRLQRMAKYSSFFKFRKNSIIDLRYKNGFAKTN